MLIISVIGVSVEIAYRCNSICIRAIPPAHQIIDGQYYSHSILKQEEWYSLQDFVRLGSLNMVLVLAEELNSICRTHPRFTELLSRFTVQEEVGVERLEVGPGSVQEVTEEVGSFRYRSFCCPPQFPTGVIFQLSPRPRGFSFRRSSSELGSQLLCLSSLSPSRQSATEDQSREVEEGGDNCSQLAISDLVPSSSQPFDYPLILPEEHSLLRNPLGEFHPLVLDGSLSLTAWRVSGLQGHFS
uniref:Uncharacterized protein n=1 Tax=Amphimedon queenslandica TaxID=400682 RepID=A0A1X7TH97_AMPQE